MYSRAVFFCPSGDLREPSSTHTVAIASQLGLLCSLPRNVLVCTVGVRRLTSNFALKTSKPLKHSPKHATMVSNLDMCVFFYIRIIENESNYISFGNCRARRTSRADLLRFPKRLISATRPGRPGGSAPIDGSRLVDPKPRPGPVGPPVGLGGLFPVKTRPPT